MTTKSKDPYAYRDRLPFVLPHSRGRAADRPTWWNVNPTGDYKTDFQTGKEYAVTFWKVCGGRSACGLELGQILFAMHDPLRPRSDRHDGLSGIEIGFIRTIGTIVDFAVQVPVIVGQTVRQRKTPKITKRQVRGAAKITGILLNLQHKDDLKRAADFDRRHRGADTVK
jgi:hypothetical protein